MSSASIKKIIPCKKGQLVEMVLDIEKYPEFVPWCIEGKVFDRNESTDLITFNGDLKVGKSILNETFSSHVSYYKEKDTIIVTNLDGPLKHLKNEWKFKEINNSTQLEFDIDFELKNNLLNAIMKKSFNFGLSKIAFRPVFLIFLNKLIGILLIIPNLVERNKCPSSSNDLTTTNVLICSSLFKGRTLFIGLPRACLLGSGKSNTLIA